MANTLSGFKNSLAGGGARPNLFKVEISGKCPGSDESLNENDNILIKAAQLPESTVGLIEVPFRGRTFKVAGDRTFAPWTITVINDENMRVRRIMEQWMQAIAQYEDGSGLHTPQEYMKEAFVTQLSRKGSNKNSTSGEGLRETMQYKFHDIFPTNISAVDLSYDSSDTIEEFTVEFQVQFWEALQYPSEGNSVANTRVNLSVTL